MAQQVGKGEKEGLELFPLGFLKEKLSYLLFELGGEVYLMVDVVLGQDQLHVLEFEPFDGQGQHKRHQVVILLPVYCVEQHLECPFETVPCALQALLLPQQLGLRPFHIVPHEGFYDFIHHIDAADLMDHLHQSMHISQNEMLQSCPEVAYLV